jgi:hypothetical protein
MTTQGHCTDGGVRHSTEVVGGVVAVGGGLEDGAEEEGVRAEVLGVIEPGMERREAGYGGAAKSLRGGAPKQPSGKRW